MKYTLFLLIVSFFLVNQTTSCFLTRKVVVFVKSSLPLNSPLLTVHCKSADDDLGYQKLPPTKFQRFAFCVKPFSTLFTCNLEWSGKKIGFQAFNAKWFPDPCVMNGVCYYIVKSDGIYFSNSDPPKDEKIAARW